MDLVGLKVKIGLRANGTADYPQFNRLPVVIAAKMDWSKYIDVHGSGWLYDCCGHMEDEPDSPRGTQWGMLLVPQQFATEAVQQFPEACSAMTATECEHFYDQHHAKDFDDEEIDETVLTKIKAKMDLGLPLTRDQQKAIDPKDQTRRGIKENRRKKFRTWKQDRKFNVVDPS